MESAATRVYFDMDGVLSVFSEEDAKAKPFNVPGSRYFRSCVPDFAAIGLFKVINNMPDMSAEVLTRIWYDVEDPDVLKAILAESKADKREWAARHISPEPRYTALMQADAKSSVLDNIPPGERRLHVLIDDDPRMCRDWRDHGGSAVQYLQPRRKVPRWDSGFAIGPKTPAEQALHAVLLSRWRPDPNRGRLPLKAACGIRNVDFDIETGIQVRLEPIYGRAIELLGGIDAFRSIMPFPADLLEAEYMKDRHFNGMYIKDWDDAAEELMPPIYKSHGISSWSIADSVCILKLAAERIVLSGRPNDGSGRSDAITT